MPRRPISRTNTVEKPPARLLLISFLTNSCTIFIVNRSFADDKILFASHTMKYDRHNNLEGPNINQQNLNEVMKVQISNSKRDIICVDLVQQVQFLALSCPLDHPMIHTHTLIYVHV